MACTTRAPEASNEPPSCLDAERAEAPLGLPAGDQIYYSGCEVVRPGPECVIAEDTSLRIWVSDELSNVSLCFDDGTSVESPPRAGHDGRLYEVEPPPSARRIEIVSAAGVAGSIGLAPYAWQALDEQWGQALTALFSRGTYDLDGIEEEIQRLPPEYRGKARATLARKGKYDRQDRIEALKGAVEEHKRADNLSALAFDLTFLAYGYQEWTNEISAAQKLFATPPALPLHHYESVFLFAYSKSTLDERLMNHRAVIEQLRGAAELARRFDEPNGLATITTVLARTYRRTGQHKAASELWSSAGSDWTQWSECEQGKFLENYAWDKLLLRESGGTGIDMDPAYCSSLEGCINEARSKYEDCPEHEQPERQANARVNLALAALQQSEALLASDQGGHQEALERARVELDRAWEWEGQLKPQSLDVRIRLWAHDIAGRIALRSADADAALAAYTALEEEENLPEFAEFRWRASLGKAQAFVLLNERERALDQFEAARNRFLEENTQIPVQMGQSSFLSQWERAAQQHVSLLIEMGLEEEAFLKFRQFRSQLTTSLHRTVLLQEMSGEEREEWNRLQARYLQVQHDLAHPETYRTAALKRELETLRDQMNAHLDSRHARASLTPPPTKRSPNPGELLLAYFELQDGWIGFAQTTDALHVRRLGSRQGDSDEAWSQWSLRPFAQWIEDASYITLLPYRELQEVAFHALPFEGDEPLLQRRPVAYSLDLPTRQTPAPLTSPTSPLLIIDPTGQYRHAREEEGPAVASLLRAAGHEPIVLRFDEATVDEALDHLGSAEVFHYAGHGALGSDPWGAYLLLHSGRLTVSDILRLDSAPDWVFLSGCVTGKTNITPVATLGLAQAFITAGSRGVLATTQNVGDSKATKFAPSLYQEGWPTEGTPAEIFREAVLSQDEVGSDFWRHYRIIVP